MENLEQELKDLRAALAEKRNIPPYCIFHNTAIDLLVKNLPSTLKELAEIKGFGEKRIKDFGQDIIDLISAWLKQNNLTRNQALKQAEVKEVPASAPAPWEKPFKDKAFIEQKILDCIKSFSGQFGKSGIKKILKGSLNEKQTFFLQKYYILALHLGLYGCLKKCKTSEIEECICNLLMENKILQTTGLRPVLKIAQEDYSRFNYTFKLPAEKITVNTVSAEGIPQDKTYHEMLLKDLGYQSFHPNQWAAIKKLLEGRKVLLVEKTGFGKSLCYQYSANLFYARSKGLTIVFSPLLSLIREQVNTLKSKGIKAACITSTQSYGENIAVLQQAARGDLAILYIAPERLENELWLDYIPKIKLALVVIDEAHCISKWGHDFRPSYRRILNLTSSLPAAFPVLAVTATATKEVERDIKFQLGEDLEVIRGKLGRDNLKFISLKCGNFREKLYWLLRIAKNAQGSGLIYCGRRADTQLVSAWLNFNGISAFNYHAGMEKTLRLKAEQDFFEGKYKAVACTNALGMGIDKKDIRFVIHFQMPQEPVSYYQEAGRAGRDFKPALAVLLYNDKDKELAEFLISKSRPEIEKYRDSILKLKTAPYTKTQLSESLDLSESDTDILLNDLLDQDIIEKEDKIYKYKPSAPPLNEDYFIWQHQQKMRELEQMSQYVQTPLCRMKYLCNYLEDYSAEDCGVCDNCKNYKFTLDNFEAVKTKIDEFYLEYSIQDFVTARHQKTEIRSLCFEDSALGQSVLQIKQGKGNLPPYLTEKSAAIIKKYFPACDLLLYVPPSDPNGFITAFAHDVACKCGLEISEGLVRVKRTPPQKSLFSKKSKMDNIRYAFAYRSGASLRGRNILLIDDIADSKATIEILSSYLLSQGAASVSAFTLVKTLR